MADLRDKRVDMILQQLEELPTLPAVAVRVLQATGDDSSSAGDVVRLIGSDPALSSRILQLTRRSDRGVRDEVTTVDRAVVLLGFEAVRNAVLAVSVFQALGGVPPTGTEPEATSGERGKSQSPAKRFSREGFWTHSLAVACCAELLAEAGGGGRGAAGVSPSEAFLCGLLHDLGKLALDVALPKSYARVIEAADLLRGDIADVERAVIGVDHQLAGKRLAERWGLPAVVRDVIWLHNQPPAGLPPSVRGRTVNLVTLADQLVRQQHLGYSGNHAYAVDQPSLVSALGLSTSRVDQAVAWLVGRMEPRAAILGLGETTSDDLYRDALSRANQELARVGGQLAVKSKRVAEKAKFFDALRQFQEALRPDPTTQQVLSAAAASAAAFLGADHVVAFSLSPGRDFGEAVLHDANGAAIESSLVELHGIADLTAADAAGVTEDELRAAQDLVGPSRPIQPQTSASPRLPASREEPPPARAGSAGSTGDGGAGTDPLLPAGDEVDWFTGGLSLRLADGPRSWVCLGADGACVGGVVWAAGPEDRGRLAPRAKEVSALAHTWSSALRTAQARDESRELAEELAAANRRLSAVQEVVLRTRALSTVGEMAAGAAHEMNNPLAVISGRSQLLATQLTDPKQKAAASIVHEQADRLSDIITDMMAFAKPQPPVIRATEAGHLVSLALTRAKEASGAADRNIEVTVGDTPLIGVDADQVAEALAEVIANALQATAERPANPPGTADEFGRVTVDARHDPWSGQVAIVVADAGIGMDEPTLKRAFDPFYSGKRAGRRRGLGLSRALRWVEASGGTIRLESRPGVGTRAVVLVPVAAESTSPGGRSDDEVTTGLARAHTGGTADAGRDDYAGQGGAAVAGNRVEAAHGNGMERSGLGKRPTEGEAVRRAD